MKRANGPLQGIDVMTEPFPGFPTDLQAQIMALMSVSEGASLITETIFENRFMHVPELSRMGADINVHGASAMIRGRARLTGAEVMATDLRASVSLVLAALAAEGETLVSRVYHLDRGYERVGLAMGVVGLAGDLSASWVKRRAAIKNYSNILPGHGGVLDRFDAFLPNCALISIAWMASEGLP